MSGNTSASGGYLVPGTDFLYPSDGELAATFQRLVSGITGLPGSAVRPRWQPTPPPQLPAATDWCAVGVVAQTPDYSVNSFFDGNGNGGLGQLIIQQHEAVEVLASFYGPNAQGYAGRAQMGMRVAQNREALDLQGVKFYDSGPVQHMPELINDQFIKRVDLPLRFRRLITQDYPVYSLLSAPFNIIQDALLSYGSLPITIATWVPGSSASNAALFEGYFHAWFAGLPRSLPSTENTFWNNNNFLAISSLSGAQGSADPTFAQMIEAWGQRLSSSQPTDLNSFWNDGGLVAAAMLSYYPSPTGDFGTKLLAWFAGLPTALPSVPNTFWNNGGVLMWTGS